MMRWIIWGTFVVSILDNGTLNGFHLSIFRIGCRFMFSIWGSRLNCNSNNSHTKTCIFSRMRRTFYYFFSLLLLLLLHSRLEYIFYDCQKFVLVSYFQFGWAVFQRGEVMLLFFVCITFRFSIVHLPHGTTRNLCCELNVHSCSVCVRVSVSELEKNVFLHCIFFLLFCAHIWRSTTKKRQRRLVSLCGDFLKFLASLLCTQKKRKKTSALNIFECISSKTRASACEEREGRCREHHTYTRTGGRLRARTDCFVLTNQNEIRCIDVIELSRMRVTPFVGNGMKLDRRNPARRRWERILRISEYRKEQCQQLQSEIWNKLSITTMSSLRVNYTYRRTANRTKRM